jgi:hypothetical protein
MKRWEKVKVVPRDAGSKCDERGHYSCCAFSDSREVGRDLGDAWWRGGRVG